MIRSDYHFHSSFSSDSDTPLERQLDEAVARGLRILCVTDHMDIDFPPNPENLSFLLDMDAYLARIAQLQKDYCKKLHFYAGVELGIQSHLRAELAAFMQSYGSRLDFVIASTHLVERMDPYEPQYFLKYSEQEGIVRYLQTILDDIETFSDFDVYGHLDYVVRYAPDHGSHYTPSEYWDYFDAILRRLISLGKGIELNTAGYAAGLCFAHPHPLVLKRYRELGGEILTIGSDAHRPEHLGYGFERIPDLLREAGFSYYTVFRNRKPLFLPIE